MMIVVFGATGRTGQHLLLKALDAGYEVTALMRTVDAVCNSDLDWIIIRVPMLTDDQVKGDIKKWTKILKTP